MPVARDIMHDDPPQPSVDADGRSAGPPTPALDGAPAGGDELLYEPIAGGVQVTLDCLRKVYVEATTACNLDCTICIRRTWREAPLHMPIERYRRLIDGLPAAEAGTPAIAFGGFGEPLSHPGILEMVAMARQRDLRVEVVTNGTTLDDTMAHALVDRGVAQLTVSVDGGDSESFSRIRGVPLSAALSGVMALCEARRRSRRSLAIGLAAVATRSNVGGLPALLDLAGDLRLDFVSISHVVPHTADMAAQALWPRAAWASVFQAASWTPRVRLARMDNEEATRPLAIRALCHGVTLPSPASDPADWRNRCRFVHEGMLAVAADGRVSPCLSLLYTHAEHVHDQERVVQSYDVGHVDTESLASIWRAERYRMFRRRVRAFEYPPCHFCGGCSYTERNQEDCYGNVFPVCGSCLWAQGLVICP
jgi:MoaA/NifB/PqqE/SkfB family radical SAM enzyme